MSKSSTRANGVFREPLIGVNAVNGSSANGLVRANRKSDQVGETGAARYSRQRMIVREPSALSEESEFRWYRKSSAPVLIT